MNNSVFQALTGGQAQPGMLNLQNALSQIKSDPAGMLRRAGLNIPEGMNDPQGILTYLLQSGQVNQSRVAMAQGFNGIQAQLASCCCDNRLATNDLKYTIATENCADRAAISDGLRDLLVAQNANTQRILDQLCNDKIDAKNDTIAQLRQELLYARGQASQDVQTATLRAGQVAEVDALYNRLSACPVPTVPVSGPQSIFAFCNNGGGCGCGA